MAILILGSTYKLINICVTCLTQEVRENNEHSVQHTKTVKFEVFTNSNLIRGDAIIVNTFENIL